MKKIYQPSALGSAHLILNKTEKKLLVLIQGLELQYAQVYASQTWFGEQLGRSRVWICQSIAKLVELGFLTATPQKSWNTLIYSARIFVEKVKARSKKLAIYRRTQAKIQRKSIDLTQYPSGSRNIVSNNRRVVGGETTEKENILKSMNLDKRSIWTLMGFDGMRSVSDFKALRGFIKDYKGKILCLGSFCNHALLQKLWE